MRHARAGHPTIYLHSNQTMEIEEFNLKGKVIGLFPEIKTENIEVPISKGDRIVLYTDGMIEARNSKDEMFGEELFMGYIRKHSKLKPHDFSKLIMGDVKSWVGGNLSLNKNDDMTLIVIDVK
jgi:serine phosphatase RsbU (regulator of sigma subunit)